jgi:hypothetical protein
MAFGTGSAIAHRAVGAVAGSFSGSDDKPAAGGAGGGAAADVGSAAPAARSAMDCTPFQREFTRCLTDVSATRAPRDE